MFSPLVCSTTTKQSPTIVHLQYCEKTPFTFSMCSSIYGFAKQIERWKLADYTINNVWLSRSLVCGIMRVWSATLWCGTNHTNHLKPVYYMFLSLVVVFVYPRLGHSVSAMNCSRVAIGGGCCCTHVFLPHICVY